MEATIQHNGKEENNTLPSFPLESTENKDQLKNTLEIMGEPKLSQQLEIITSDGSPSSKRKAANALQETTNNLKHLVTTDEVVRQSLINDNWKIVESRKSRMISTLSKYSTRSLVPPFLAQHNGISESLLSADTRIGNSTTRINTSNTTINTRISTSDTRFGTSGQVHANQEQNIHGHRGQNMGQHNGNLLSHSIDANFSYNENYGDADFQANASKAKKSSSVDGEVRQRNVPHNYHFGATETKKSRQTSSFNNSLDNDDEDDDDDDLFSITMRKKRNVPLPAFGDSDDDDEESIVGDERVPYASQWSMKDKGSLSFYDNLMDLDIKKPLYMLVPDSLGNSTPKVGELELDELSELSENEAKSNENPLSDTDDDILLRNNHPRHFSRIDSSMQTDDEPLTYRVKEAGTMTAADIIAEIEAARAGNPRQRSNVPLLTKSTEGEETDPKFIRRPATCFEVLEGEAISIKCQLNGSEPIDVFWFRDMEEVTQLEEDDRCDIDISGDMYTLTLFDTTKKDGGQYLCIGVNSHGHCVQGFQVNIQDNKNQGIPPSFVVGLVNIEVFKGDKATFGCKVAGYPPPRVLWYHRGERCKDGRTYKIANDGNGGHKLVMRDIGQTNTLFTAVARNVNGEVTSNSEVNVKERELENTNTVSLNSASSPYPDVEELMLIAQKVSSTPSEVTPSRTASRFSFSLEKLSDEASKRDREKIHSNANFKEQKTQFKAYAENSDVFLPLPATNKDLSDDEQELNVSYQEFERLFEARLISRSQLNSGRVWKKDLEKIQAFLKTISTNGEKPHEIQTDEDDQLRVNCGLKSIEPSFYRRDYVVNMDSARRNVHSESNSNEYQHTAGGILRSNSLISSSTAKCAKVLPTRLDNISFQDKAEDLNRNQIMSATREHSEVELRKSKSVDRNSEGDYDMSLDDKFVMPCVKELLLKFDSPLSPEAPIDEVSPLKRIYSLTGRSVPEFVREKIQRQVSSSSVVEKRNKGKTENTSENYNRFSLPAQHSTYTDGPPVVTAASTNVHGHAKTEAITTQSQMSNHSAINSIKQDNFVVKSQLQSSHLETSVSDSHQTDFKDDDPLQSRDSGDIVRQRAAYWQKFITHQQMPEKFPEMINGSLSFNSDDD